jgi:hypothetical protein
MSGGASLTDTGAGDGLVDSEAATASTMVEAAAGFLSRTFIAVVEGVDNVTQVKVRAGESEGWGGPAEVRAGGSEGR